MNARSDSRRPLANLIPLLLALGACTAPAAAQSDPWRFGGDLRTAMTWDERAQRDGSRDDSTAARARVRAFAEWKLSDSLQFRARVAGRYGSDQDGFATYLRAAGPTRNGAALGDTTLDEFFLRIAPAGADWQLRLGRFQSVFALPTLQGKGLDHNDGPNLDVHWTDGLHWQKTLAPKLNLHATLMHIPADGPGWTHRAPLDFSRSGSRWGAHFALDARGEWGPVIQRGLGLTVLPEALAIDGLASARRIDYRALSARATAAWPIGANGSRLLLGGELGRAERAPAGRSPSAWQVELDWEGPERRHSSGIVFGRAGAWLTSSDFRENEQLGEVRYLWRVRSDLSLDARWRWRRETNAPASALRERVDRDVYLRATWRF